MITEWKKNIQWLDISKCKAEQIRLKKAIFQTKSKPYSKVYATDFTQVPTDFTQVHLNV